MAWLWLLSGEQQAVTCSYLHKKNCFVFHFPAPPLVFLLVHPPAQFLTGEVALAEVGQGMLYVPVRVTCELDLWLCSGKCDNPR